MNNASAALGCFFLSQSVLGACGSSSALLFLGEHLGDPVLALEQRREKLAAPPGCVSSED